METTWASGALELLRHADEHMHNNHAFDKRIAFISIDASVETAIRTFISMPKNLSNLSFTFKEKEEIGNSFPKMVNLLSDKIDDRLSGIELSDIEFYHRLRNQLYHDGTGLSVDQNHLEAYRAIAAILLTKLFKVEIEISENGLPGLISFWNEINSLIRDLFNRNNIDFNQTFKWEMALQKAILNPNQIAQFNELNRLRNEQVHSLPEEINLAKISYAYTIASELRNSLIPETKESILKYLKEHPKEAFSSRAIGQVFSISNKFSVENLGKLEEEGQVVSGIESESMTKLFQFNSNGK